LRGVARAFGWIDLRSRIVRRQGEIPCQRTCRPCELGEDSTLGRGAGIAGKILTAHGGDFLSRGGHCRAKTLRLFQAPAGRQGGRRDRDRKSTTSELQSLTN